jgi:VanZ family protein
VILGTLLSASLEMVQIFAPGRHCSAMDLLDNSTGSALGVVAGILFERIARPGKTRQIADRAALALLFCWIASLLFPVFPVISLPVWRYKLALFADMSVSGSIILPLISAAFCWFAAGRLMTSAGLPSARVWLTLSLLLVPAQILIVTRQPLAADFVGAVCGVAVFLLWDASSRGVRAAAWLFPGLLIVRGIAPFHFTAQAQEFSWIPFGPFLDMDWQQATRVLLEKSFLYGTAIWLLRSSGLSWRAATAIVAAALASIEIAQMHIAGRTPEITDPLLAVLFGLGLSRLRDRAVS